jgi:hypothetical protein
MKEKRPEAGAKRLMYLADREHHHSQDRISISLQSSREVTPHNEVGAP